MTLGPYEQCPGCQKLQMTELNLVWHMILCSCANTATVGFKWLKVLNIEFTVENYFKATVLCVNFKTI